MNSIITIIMNAGIVKRRLITGNIVPVMKSNTITSLWYEEVLAFYLIASEQTSSLIYSAAGHV